MPDEQSFNTGELTLKYEEWGRGDSLVLLHGLTSSRQGWATLIPLLAENWHVYAPDLRGHGRSDRAPDDRYTNPDYARDVIAFLKYIDEPVVLLGHSLGAMTAIIVAAGYPVGVKALVLLDPPLFSYSESVSIQPETAHWFNLVATVNEGDPSFETRVERLRAAMPDAPDAQINGMAQWIGTTASGAAATALRDEIWGGVDLPQTLQQIQCPTLMIHGDWDAGGAVRAEDVAMFKANLPSASVVRLPEANHGLKMQEAPHAVLDPIATFLQSL